MLEDGEIDEDIVVEKNDNLPQSESNNSNNNNNHYQSNSPNSDDTFKRKTYENTHTTKRKKVNYSDAYDSVDKSLNYSENENEDDNDDGANGVCYNENGAKYRNNFNNDNRHSINNNNNQHHHTQQPQANSLMSIPISSLNLVSKSIKENELGHNNLKRENEQPVSLMSLGSSGWSTPASKNEIIAKTNGDVDIRFNSSTTINPPSTSAPKSIFDLFTNPTFQSSTSTSNSASSGATNFVDPVITEKENKPNKFNKNSATAQPLMSENNNKRKATNNDKIIVTAETTLANFEYVDKKAEKKRKYFEQQKKETEKQQQKQQQQQQREPIVCKFFLEGRCQKGNDCPFSHNAPLNKKLEVCKYYLNGYCVKDDKCLFMHSEFPCKFYHRINPVTGAPKNECLQGNKCRFSHDPIKNPQLREAFEKYLAEIGEDTHARKLDTVQSLPSSTAVTPSDNIPSLMAISVAPAALAAKSTNKQTISSPTHPSSPPPQNLAPLPLMTTSIMSLNRASDMDASRDVDFRNFNTKTTSLTTTTGDVDERIIPNASKANSITPTCAKPSIDITTNNSANYNSLKEKLIVTVMKAISDDGSVLSQIPKQTLSELLVKLISTKPENQLSLEAIIALLATFTTVTSNKDASLSPSSPVNNDNRFNKNNLNQRTSKYDYDDFYDDDENNLIIEGNVGEIPYTIHEIDVEPSKLWSNPPSTSVAGILAASLGSENTIDSENDPRIKYYSNKANLFNVANFQRQSQLLSQQQQQQNNLMTPSSPSSTTAQTQNQSPIISNITDLLLKQQSNKSSNAITNPLSGGSRIDPRLAARTFVNNNINNSSPARTTSPPSIQDALLNALKASNSQQTNPLLSLPDFQPPPPSQRNSLSSLLAQQATSAASSTPTSNESNGIIKLSIEDYKRKKPTSTGLMSSSTTNSSSGSNLSALNANSPINSSLILASLMGNQSSSSSSSQLTANNNSSNSTNGSSIPGLSIFSNPINLQAPQSLHELLRNYQS